MAKKILFQSRNVVNWERTPKIEGQVMGAGEIMVEDRPRPYILVNTGEHTYQVFQSAALDDLFKVAKVGRFVSIEFVALVETSKGRQFRQFISNCWEDDEAPKVAEPTAPVARKRGRPKKNA